MTQLDSDLYKLMRDLDKLEMSDEAKAVWFKDELVPNDDIFKILNSIEEEANDTT